MNVERIRSVLGVWAPMAIGLFIIATSINFYFTATLAGDLESWRLVCSGGAFFVGGLLILSTYGRYAKTKEWRGKGSPEASHQPPAPGRNETPDPDRDFQDRSA
jgi:hypothetical protein